MARNRLKKGRDVSGILLLDKPAGMTSNAVLQRVKRLFFARKAGHTGSLDPIATGLLPICLGEATKVSAYQLNADKGYQVTIKLGQTTTTGDIEGDVVQRRQVPELTSTQLEPVFARFIGEISQIPPMYSALKKDGQPLYKLARQGIEVERKPRLITVFSIKELALRDDEIDLEVICSKGTYIRTLAEDIGEVLGCGGHVKVLRRILSGMFDINAAVSVERLEKIRNQASAEALDELLLPMDTAVQDFPVVSLNTDMAFYVRQGQAVRVPQAPTDGRVRLYTGENEFLGIGHILEDGRVAPKRLINQPE